MNQYYVCVDGGERVLALINIYLCECGEKYRLFQVICV